MFATNDLVTNATGFVTLMGALSLGVERTVETIKGIVPYLQTKPNPDPKKDEIRAVVLRIIAIICGAFAAMGVQSQVTATAPVLSYENIHFLSYILIGLLTAGGSAFWNQVLDVLQTMKTKGAPAGGQGGSQAGAPAGPAVAVAKAGG
jgi:hypothetical protein